MPVNTEVKGTLAKLLATENLNVEHRNVETAYFDVLNRILCLPIWKDVSADVYDMLVGHEVGHALYTPVEYGEVSQDLPQDVLNVLEDVRVEKLMKRRYPGLSKSFYRGYNELNDKDFFELDGKDISKMSLIDRINVHYKCGVFGNRTIVPFERDEMQWVNRAADTETFEDTVQLATDLVEYLKLKKEEQMQQTNISTPQTQSGGGDQQGEDEVPQSGGPANSQMQDNGGRSSSQPQDTQDGGDTTQERGGSPIGGKNEVTDEFKSETYRALTENQQNLVDKKAKEYVYVNLPTVNLDKMIVSYKKTFVDFNEFMKNQRNRHSDQVTSVAKKYKDYKKESIKTVNYLAKEFECKKAADQYHRANTANTGVLDTQKLHTFKWNEDLFKKVTTIPDGKNHGLVFYLDWSGSMSSCMTSTLKQLYDLIWFCKKVGIPFRVYAFSDSHMNSTMFPGTPSENKVDYLTIDHQFRLFEFFSSRMNAQTLDKMMEYMYYNCDHFYNYNNKGEYNYEYGLSGTPLVETIVTTPQVVEKFKSEEKVQKVNVVYLTDGEAAHPHYNKYIPALRSVSDQPMYGDRVYVVRDPKSRYQCQLEYDNNGITNSFVEYISNIVDYNLLGFRLCTKSEVHVQANIAQKTLSESADLIKEWEKNKSVAIKGAGFDELYLMQLPKHNQNRYTYWNPDDQPTDDFEVKDTSSKGQLATAFKKHMTGKMINKTILSKFVGQVA
jgi:hypothetical protein